MIHKRYGKEKTRRSYEMWCWMHMERISWIERKTNEDVLRKMSIHECNKSKALENDLTYSETPKRVTFYNYRRYNTGKDKFNASSKLL